MELSEVDTVLIPIILKKLTTLRNLTCIYKNKQIIEDARELKYDFIFLLKNKDNIINKAVFIEMLKCVLIRLDELISYTCCKF